MVTGGEHMSNLEHIAFQLILHSGNGRSSAMEAIACAKKGDIQHAEEKIKAAKEDLLKAHKIQTTFIQEEIREKKNDISLLLIHAQDHLMNAITIKDLAMEIIELYELIQINVK
jgi:cellobiose PTS system EIIA component